MSSDPLYKHVSDTLAKQNAARPIHAIAREIYATWEKPNYAAVPYLSAMRSLTSMADKYGDDSAQSVVAYFLSNATTWRGPDAKRIKAELKAMLSKVRR